MVDPFREYGEPIAVGAEAIVFKKSPRKVVILLEKLDADILHHKLVWWDIIGIPYTLVNTSIDGGLMVSMPRLKEATAIPYSYHMLVEFNWRIPARSKYTLDKTIKYLARKIPKVDHTLQTRLELDRFLRDARQFKKRLEKASYPYDFRYDLEWRNIMNYKGKAVIYDPFYPNRDDSGWFENSSGSMSYRNTWVGGILTSVGLEHLYYGTSIPVKKTSLVGNILPP